MRKNIFPIIPLILLIFLSCSKDDTMRGDTGTGGSMARFTIRHNYLYTVDHMSLHTFGIAQPEQIKHLHKQFLGFGIETIFPSADYLFIGAIDGMHIYGLTNPENPNKISFTPHFISYDPVVVQGDFAYVTLRSAPNMQWGENVLLVFDISKPDSPQLLAEHQMTNPRGLGIDNDLLFICDDMLKVFQVGGNGYDIELLQTFNIQAIDVIPSGNRLYVVAEDGLYQYDFDGKSVSLLSKLTISKP
ncbi:MAG: hypothetical protein EA393_12420 [Bacteroidetes bacterium]|nr:MAG: hypothetical protein EA393_12420 [Bacteroidota bacterium]